MHTSQLFKTLVPTLLVAGGLSYSGFGTADGVAADAGSPQQSRVTASRRMPTSGSDLMAAARTGVPSAIHLPTGRWPSRRS
jgi:hypothetical protein